MQRIFTAFLVSGIWISLSEFVRNELLFKGKWIGHYAALGLVFPSTMINNLLWGVWSFLLAALILYLTRKMSTTETVAVAWLFAFVLMWIVVANLAVLPLSLLLWAVPLSLLEVWIATLLCVRIAGPRDRTDT